MATNTSISITTTRDNVKKQKSITYIDPTATSEEILQFAHSITNLTNDTYQETTRIDKTELDTVTPRPITRITYRKKNGASYLDTQIDLTNPVINVHVSELYHVNDADNACWWFQIYTPDDGAAPTGSSSDENTTFSYTRRDANQAYWMWQFLTVPAGQVAGNSFTIDLNFIQSPLYPAYSLPISINITADEEG